jgi:nucleoside-diphosphate-sugar epimerase
MKSRTVLVTGAAGGLGRTVCRVLLEAHVQVKGLVRPEDRLEDLPLNKENLAVGYIEDPETVAEAMRGVDAVVNCAALLPNALHLGREAFQRVNVDGAINVLRVAATHGVPKAVFFSTISVVDHHSGRILPSNIQEYVKNPQDAYLASKIEVEKSLQKEAGSFRGQVSIIRPAFIYGPANFSVWQDALKLVRQGKMVIIGDGNISLPLIYADDIAAFVLLLLDQPTDKPRFDIHILSSHEATTMRQVFYFIADYLGAKRPRHFPYLPLSLAASVADVLPDILKVGRLKLLTTARVRQYSRGYDLSGVLNPPPLGFVPPTGYEVGLPRMLDDYQKHLAKTER